MGKSFAKEMQDIAVIVKNDTPNEVKNKIKKAANLGQFEINVVYSMLTDKDLLWLDDEGFILKKDPHRDVVIINWEVQSYIEE